MTDPFINKISEYIVKEELLKQNDKVVLGVSGGADSVALLFVLNTLKEQYNLSLLVVSVDHGLRKEAKEECDYVKSLCDKMNVPFVLKSFDVEKLSKEKGKGTEETGRRVRYDSFTEAALSMGEGTKIAVAHNMNDLCETMLFHLFRGTGPKGLCSILPKRDNIIRPLLCVERKEIEEWLHKSDIKYYTDQTNLTDDYTRNMIRHNIIDYAVNNINSGAVSHMANTAMMLRDLTDFVDIKTEDLYKKACTKEKGEIIVDTALLEKESSFVVRSLYKRCIDLTVPTNRDITIKHFEAIEKLSLGSESGELNLPYGIHVLYEAGKLKFKVFSDNEPEFEPVLLSGDEGSVKTCFGITVKWRVEDRSKDFRVFKNEYTKCFDYDKILNRPILRTIKEGDRITVNAGLQTKKLSDYFIDEKIPCSQRKKTLLIADNENIVWVIGHRIGEFAKITDDTKKILYVEVIKEDIHG